MSNTSIRREPLYITREVGRWLYLIAKSESLDEPDISRRASPDQVADDILRQAIREQYPQLSEHEKEIAKLEKKLLQSLQNERGPK